MELIGELFWSGQAWPAAEIAGRTGEDFIFKTTGKGRHIQFREPAAWWRNFSEVDLNDANAVIGFVRRRGDPFGMLSPTNQADSSKWFEIHAPLNLAASRWTRNRTGTSVCGEEHTIFMSALMACPEFREGVDYRPQLLLDGGFSLAILPQTLAGFMITSAILHLQSRVDMALCQQCGDWFVERRSGTRFCSPSCRAAYATSKRKGEE
ncbi:hypothetical protein GHJ84_08740 [Sinorhizobium meliloti]|uniref:hypothetical protein n=1 Tax=Rhizobium meliloti TaxID=382 RepID=UPI0012969179|nr:hypothetical protein [Sinorhizobium meliloti]MQX21082.1 hypothetical protein [Sinorhizobium meliloti]